MKECLVYMVAIATIGCPAIRSQWPIKQPNGRPSGWPSQKSHNPELLDSAKGVTTMEMGMKDENMHLDSIIRNNKWASTEFCMLSCSRLDESSMQQDAGTNVDSNAPSGSSPE